MTKEEKIQYLKECIELDEGLIESYQRDLKKNLPNSMSLINSSVFLCAQIHEAKEQIQLLEKEIEREFIAKSNC